MYGHRFKESLSSGTSLNATVGGGGSEVSCWSLFWAKRLALLGLRTNLEYHDLNGCRYHQV